MICIITKKRYDALMERIAQLEIGLSATKKRVADTEAEIAQLKKQQRRNYAQQREDSRKNRLYIKQLRQEIGQQKRK
jgi:hypothetical protein